MLESVVVIIKYSLLDIVIISVLFYFIVYGVLFAISAVIAFVLCFYLCKYLWHVLQQFFVVLLWGIVNYCIITFFNNLNNFKKYLTNNLDNPGRGSNDWGQNRSLDNKMYFEQNVEAVTKATRKYKKKIVRLISLMSNLTRPCT